jgi:hypothetical protein
MYQKFISMQKGLVAAAMLMAVAPSLAAAATTPEGCQRTVVKEAQKFAAKKATALRKCEDGVLKGKVVGPCPDAKNAAAIAKAESALIAKIGKKCLDLTVADTGLGENCPRAACASAIDTIADAALCVACNVNEIVDDVSLQTYGTLQSPSTDKDVLGCQRTYAKEIIGAFGKISKVFAKCEDGVIKNGSGSCPDAKSATKISDAAAKVGAKITKKCPDAPTQAAAIKLGAAFGAMGGVANAGARVTDIADTQVQVSINAAVCGNAAIEAGETCDDGNRSGDIGVGASDSCPADCTIAACSVSGTSTATVNITAPNSEAIASATILLYYDDAVVEIPGSNNDAQVQAAVAGAGFFSITANDVNYALRAVAIDATLTGESSGPVMTIDYNECGGAASAADFDCFVIDASDNAFVPVSGVTCSVVP